MNARDAGPRYADMIRRNSSLEHIYFTNYEDSFYDDIVVKAALQSEGPLRRIDFLAGCECPDDLERLDLLPRADGCKLEQLYYGENRYFHRLPLATRAYVGQASGGEAGGMATGGGVDASAITFADHSPSVEERRESSAADRSPGY